MLDDKIKIELGTFQAFKLGLGFGLGMTLAAAVILFLIIFFFGGLLPILMKGFNLIFSLI
jgi:hypothetical protein